MRLESYNCVENSKKKKQALTSTFICRQNKNMKNIYKILFLVLFSSTSFAETPFQDISMLTPEHKIGFSFLTSAYVAHIFTCPACPKGSQCKPCMENNLIISEVKGRKKNYSKLTSKDMVVFTPKAGKFKVGLQYEFTLKLTHMDTSPTKQAQWSAELVSSRPLN